MPDRSRRAGLTLIEIMVALAIGSIVVLVARLVLDTAGRQTGSLQRATTTDDSLWTQWITLREMAWQVPSPPVDSLYVTGDPRSARLRTRCLTAFGWSEACYVRITVRKDQNACTLSIDLESQVTLNRLGLIAGCHLLYLADPANAGVWTTTWATRGMLPNGMAIVNGRDTTLFRIGAPL